MVLPGVAAEVPLELDELDPDDVELDEPEEDDDVDVDVDEDNELGVEGLLPHAVKMAIIKMTKQIFTGNAPA